MLVPGGIRVTLSCLISLSFSSAFPLLPHDPILFPALCHHQSRELQTQSALFLTGFKCTANYSWFLSGSDTAFPGI